jgi:hypothetical protein
MLSEKYLTPRKTKTIKFPIKNLSTKIFSIKDKNIRKVMIVNKRRGT